ncbi:unnamed protein product [Larinioides sclopetarius]|uniref:Uncharacterized protein n=1 Tax=Larinioides sclopetarius TaxID=280406 RepID=A0AAV1ZRN0_9ARAC
MLPSKKDHFKVGTPFFESALGLMFGPYRQLLHSITQLASHGNCRCSHMNMCKISTPVSPLSCHSRKV